MGAWYTWISLQPTRIVGPVVQELSHTRTRVTKRGHDPLPGLQVFATDGFAARYDFRDIDQTDTWEMDSDLPTSFR